MTEATITGKDKLTPAQIKRIGKLRTRAEAAYDKQNYGWAVELYWEIYILDRSDSEGLQKMLLSALARKNLSPHPFLYAVQHFFSNIPIYFKSLSVKDTDDKREEFYEVFESILKTEPDSGYVLLKLGGVYENQNLLENAAILLENYTRRRKSKVDVMRRAAELYLKLNKLEKARSVFKKILSVNPSDMAAQKKLKDVLAMGSIDSSKLKDQSGFLGLAQDKEASKKAQIQMKLNKTKEEINYLISEKNKEIGSRPDNISLRYELIELLKEKGDNKTILAVMEEVAKLAKGDLKVLIEKVDTEINIKMEENEKRVKAGESPEGLETSLNEFKKKSYGKLVTQFPTNVEVKYKLAHVCFELGQNERALQLFQVTSGAPEFSSASINRMGQIFFRKEMYDMAVDEFKNGIDQIPQMTAIKKELIYNLGMTYEKMNQFDEALEQYKIIFKMDVGFKDISQRIEASYKK